MPSFKCCCRILLVCFWLTAGQSGVHADGFVLGRDGKYVPEKEQLAFIDWADGHERLSVATRTEASDGPALWIVPIPANPKDVRAEPVATFRHVQYTRSAASKARDLIASVGALTVVLNTAGLGCPLLFGSNFAVTFSQVGDVEVHQRIEKLGMVVEILTAKTTEGLDRYLQDRLHGVRATGITALGPYLNRDFTLVCGWPSADAPVLLARALDIEFPSADVFYPLRASQVYESEIETTLFVRGWVRPNADIVLPGLRCRYVFGQVSDVDLNHAFTIKNDPSLPGRQPSEQDVPLTRVELAGNPRQWTQDLTLEPGTPIAITVAQGIENAGHLGLWLTTMLLGALLMVWAPLRLFPREHRHWTDWLWGGIVGAAIGFSIAASAIMFYCWLASRSAKGLPGLVQDNTKSASVDSTFAWCALPAVLLILLTILTMWPVFFPDFPSAFVFVCCLTVCTLVITQLSLYRLGKKGILVLWFALAHLAIVVVICIGLHQWLGEYE